MKNKLSRSVLFLLAPFLFSAQLSFADIRLPQLISDGMVLQREAPLKIWGWADPGEKVKISFNHKKYVATTAANGQWSLVLPAMNAGGPYQMEVDGSNHITIHDILIGDVWFCSGQSNMVLPMERVKEKYPDEITNANYPQIRNFFVPTLADITTVHDDLPPGKWSEATPKNVLTFGAASYFFAKQLYNKYHVPIGLINSSVGGTPAQAWISEQGLKNVSQYTDRLRVLRDTNFVNYLRKTALAYDNKLDQQLKLPDKGLTGAKKWYDTSFAADGWHHFWLPGFWADQGVRNLNGIVWFRKEITLPASMAGKPAKLFVGRIVDADQTYVNGVFVGNTTYQYPPRRYQVAADVLKAGKNTIVVRVTNTAGKGGFVPDKPYRLVIDNDMIDLRGDWTYQVGQVFDLPGNKPEGFSAQNEPTGLFNTMVAPAINYAVKGFLWYQGEANTAKPEEYGQLLQALIADWRNRWKNDKLPFVYAQLPGFMDVDYSPMESKWAQLREEQLETLAVPNTAMAVTIDAGEWNDVHPLDKKDVGDRLALGAEKIAYGDTSIVYSGPIYQSAKIEGTKIEITFSNTGSGLIAKGGDLAQFAIAEADKQYVWATAIIKDGRVIVWNDAITQPRYVRYAWADNPEGANLYNQEGLPASPFTTDKP